MSQDFQSAYWDDVAESSYFEDPLNFEILEGHLPKSARILDLGCGYGRLIEQLIDRGYTNVEGADTSARMVERADEASLMRR